MAFERGPVLTGKAKDLQERGLGQGEGFGKAAVAAGRGRKAGAGSNSGERGPALGRRGWRSLLSESGVSGEMGVFERGLVLMGEAEGLLGEERGF